MKKLMKSFLGCMVIAFVFGMLVVTPAQAIIYDITSDHATGGLGTPPFGTVELLQNGSTVDVTVALNTGYQFVKTGSADFMNFKFNAVDIVLGDITIDPHTPTLTAATGVFNGDGTGNFSYGITNGGGNGLSGGFSDDIVFHVANATIADLTHPNSLGILFVADLYSASTGNTGPADVTVPRVPEPASVLLLGLGLIGLAGARRMLKQ